MGQAHELGRYASGEHMLEIKIICDAEKMKDPDLDIRYELPDYLASKISVLVDDGYDYGEEETILKLYMSVK